MSAGYIYAAGYDGLPDRVKIGLTIEQTVEERVKQWGKSTGSPGKVVIHYQQYVHNVRYVEREIHKALKRHAVDGGGTEWFTNPDVCIAFTKERCKKSANDSGHLPTDAYITQAERDAEEGQRKINAAVDALKQQAIKERAGWDDANPILENLWAKPDPISVRERTPEREEWHQRWLQAGRNIENHKKAGQETPKALAVLKDKRKRKVLKNFLKQNRAAHEEMQSWVWHLYHHKGRLGVHGSPRKIKLPLSWYDGESEFESSIVEAIGRNGGIDAYARKYNLW